MADQLADEMLVLILDLVLEVNDDDLMSCNPGHSPFADRMYSNSDVLLVCKRWMRTATPSLLRTVIIRSVAQSEAFARALKKNPSFGPDFVRRIRFEGGYGNSVRDALLHTPNIDDLCIQIYGVYDTEVMTMFDALRTLRPRRVALRGWSPLLWANSMNQLVIDGLRKCLSEWRNLEIALTESALNVILTGEEGVKLAPVGFSCATVTVWSTIFPFFTRVASIFEKVREVKKLQFVRGVWAFKGRSVDTCVNESGFDLDKFGRQVFLRDMNLNRLRNLQEMVLAYRVEQHLALFSTSQRRPMDDLPQALQCSIWSSILRNLITVDSSLFFHLDTLNRVVLVCAMFRDIVRLLRLEHLRLLSPHRDKVDALEHMLKSRPFLGSSSTSLKAHRQYISNRYHNLDLSTNKLTGIIPYLQNLTLVHLINAPPELAILLADTVGTQLLRMKLLCSKSDGSDKLLQVDRFTIQLHFPALRQLELAINVGDQYTEDWLQFYWCLPSLTSLSLDSPAVVERILPSLTAGLIPQLQDLKARVKPSFASNLTEASFTPYESFVERWGRSLRAITIDVEGLLTVFEHCPALFNIRVVSEQVFQERDWERFLSPPKPQRRVQTIEVPSVLQNMYLREDWTAPVTQRWHDLVQVFNDISFPALEEVRISAFTWPTDVGTIQPCLFIEWAPRLQARGVRLVDETGKLWRPRLVSSRDQ
ncbi:hypothetical protein BKA62DRAFT_189529 [Auriculariales sp. MPI-PUGE-AT-0066]|nr:hypothetical protein BKA62DRAFT_189529 [Auriculariales sp. MPI-PUGE-AT-0066]